MSSRSLYESIPCLNGLSVSLGNADNVFSVDADTGNLTMNKVASSPNSYLLQVMVSLMTLQTEILYSWLPRKQGSCHVRN